VHKRRYLIGALLGVIGTLVVSSSAFGGVPTGQTLQVTLSPKKQNKKAFGPAKLHTVLGITYDSFTGSPSPSQALFRFDRNVKFVNGNIPACPQGQLESATSTAAVQANCGPSIVGQGAVDVNNRTGAFANPNPVLLASGGPTTMLVWVRVADALTLVLRGDYSRGANTLDLAGLPNAPGADLTLLDITLNKKKTGNKSYYVMARCKKKKWTHSETTTYHGGMRTSASSTQKCEQRK
jgi:hypothetical protein